MSSKYYSYRLDHDYGFAPNPFGAYCTLANCMPKIRINNNLQLGDWIFGLGSKVLKNEHHLIYAMRVSEKVIFDQYWNDARFQYKKPTNNGSLKSIHGDNIYYMTSDDEWGQLGSLHSNPDGSVNQKHLKKDLSGKYVLISNCFYYFGENHFKIPLKYIGVCGNNPRGFAGPSIPIEIGDAFIAWIEANFIRGIHGDPINWIDYKQIKLFV